MTEENSAFATKLQEAMSNAMGRQPQEVVEEVQEEEVEIEVEEDAVEVEDTTDEVKEEPKAAVEEEFKLIPKEWTKAEQESFQEALDNPDLKDAAEAFISRYENLRKDYHKKAGERAEYAKKVSAWDTIFDERAKEALRQKGMDETQYVRNLLNVEQGLITNPVQTMKWLINTYKVDPKELVSGVSSESEDDGYVDYDKTIAEMKRELDELKNANKQSKAQSAASEEAYIAKQINDFEFAIDENGEPKYPLFKEVRDEMGILLNKGKAKTLEEAYEMSPTVRAKALEERSVMQSREDMEAEKKRVAKAKKAARGVSSTRAVTQQPIKMSLEDRLREKLREARV